MQHAALPEGILPAPLRRDRARRALGSIRGFTRQRPLAAAGAGIIGLLCLLSIAPGLIAPYQPDDQSPSDILQGVSQAHIFGTDNFGRDVFSRVVYGARTSLFIGVGA